jgi:thioredoxin-like negative regulator of GroEL
MKFFESKKMKRVKKLFEQIFPYNEDSKNIQKEIKFKVVENYISMGDSEEYKDVDGDIAAELYLATNDGGFKKIWPKRN